MVPDAPAHRPSHVLVADDYPSALATLVDETLPRTNEAVVALDESELEMDFPDATRCADTWAAVRESFQPLPGDPVWDGRGSEYQLCGDETAVRRLCDLVDGVCGTHFVSQLRLAVDGQPAFEAVPHHSAATVDAAPLGGGAFLESVASRLADSAACLVADETHVEWEADGSIWRVSGSSLCVESADGTRATCWGLSNLLAARVAPDGSAIELTWDTGDPDGVVERALYGLTRALASRPERVPCPDRETAQAVRDAMASLLERYDGRRL